MIGVLSRGYFPVNSLPEDDTYVIRGIPLHYVHQPVRYIATFALLAVVGEKHGHIFPLEVPHRLDYGVAQPEIYIQYIVYVGVLLLLALCMYVGGASAQRKIRRSKGIIF